MKLLFFTSAVETDKNNEGLLGIFNNWVAMPYGHIEKDIMDLVLINREFISCGTKAHVSGE